MASHTTSESILAALFAAAATFTLWSSVDPRLLVAWCALMAVPPLAREQVRRAYERTAPDIRDSAHRSWGCRLCACSGATGLAWGGVVLLLPASADPALVMLIGLHVGYVALASGLQAACLKAFLAFAIPSTCAFLALAWGAPATSLAAAALPLLLMTGLAAAFCAHRNARSLVSSIEQRFEHEEQAVRLAAERDRAELATLAKNRFLAAASHDLRQPLHAIGLYAGCLSQRLGTTDTDGVLPRMQRSIGALTALFDGILDVSRLDAHAMEHTPCPVPLDPLLQRLEHEYGMQARAKGLSLSITTRTGLVAHVDPTLLERVLINLIGNAVKFTATGHVAVTAQATADGLSLAVSDTGRGIAEADRDRVFSEYHQLRHAGLDSAGGRGLGLAIVERLCRLMGGSITLASTPGRGSEFTVSIPRAATADGPAAHGAPASNAVLWCRHAWLIDADPTVVDSTRRALAHLGCRTESAPSVKRALQRLATSADAATPDVLIIDIGQRGVVRGRDAVRRIREEFNADIPALLTTGDTACRLEADSTDARVRLLQKPCTAARLHEELSGLRTARAEFVGIDPRTTRMSTPLPLSNVPRDDVPVVGPTEENRQWTSGFPTSVA